MAGEYSLTYAGIPFLLDTARLFRMPGLATSSSRLEDRSQLPPTKYQPFVDLVDELDRMIPFMYLQDFSPVSTAPPKNLAGIAFSTGGGEAWPHPGLRINDYYYPTGASRWSVFRGLVTTTLMQEMLRESQGTRARTFVMENVRPDAQNIKLETELYMLPPRPLAEHLDGTNGPSRYEGLYLITLVDERYYWQSYPFTAQPNADKTWARLIQDVQTALGIQTIVHSTIETVYGKPEPDSALWMNSENVCVALDAIAANTGRTVVRKYDGRIYLLTTDESEAQSLSNRGPNNQVVRAAGGEIFNSGAQVGDTLQRRFSTLARQTVLPRDITVTFPRYVAGDDPVPHYLNPRYANPRPSAWYEDSYGDAHRVSVPISSGSFRVSSVSGGFQMSGTGTMFLHDTAKALFSDELDADPGESNDPLNHSGLVALSMKLAQDRWDVQAAQALDEVYDGTITWEPEGIHDLIWTYSARSRGAFTRVMRTEWNRAVTEFQHATPAASGMSSAQKGVGGKSVAQTYRDSFGFSGYPVETTLGQGLTSGGLVAVLDDISHFPTQNRWKGEIESHASGGVTQKEIVLFEGTSGGVSISGVSGSVNIVYRAIDGSLNACHSGSSVSVRQVANTVYGPNLITFESGQFAYPHTWTSGGIQEVRVVPQTQTVQCLDGSQLYASGMSSGRVTVVNSQPYFSGKVLHFNPQADPSWPDIGTVPGEYCWLAPRSSGDILSGGRFDGQFLGYGPEVSSGIAPGRIYAIQPAPYTKVRATVGSGGISEGGNAIIKILGSTGFTGEEIRAYDQFLATSASLAADTVVTAYYDWRSNKWWIDGAQC